MTILLLPVCSVHATTFFSSDEETVIYQYSIHQPRENVNCSSAKLRGKNIVLICHGGIIEASFIFFFGLSTLRPPSVYLHPKHTSITIWYKATPEGGPNIWQLETFNDATHLRNR